MRLLPVALLLLAAGGGGAAPPPQNELADIDDGDYDERDVNQIKRRKPPAFEIEEDWSQPVELVGYAAQTFTLSCPALGTPTPTVRWFKDGAVIDRATPRRFEPYVFSAFSLTIHNAVAQRDGGIYSCVASNDHGSRTRQFLVSVVGRTVAEKPIVKAGQPGNHTVQVGATLQLHCQVEVVDHAR